MSNKIKFSMRFGAQRDLRSSPEVTQLLESTGRSVYDALPNAQEDYSMYNTQGKSRRRVGIVTATRTSRKDNAQHSTLLTALENGCL